MGQKTNPIGLRVAVNKDWRSKWYAEKKEFSKLLTEDREIRELLKKKLESASVPRILIERATNRCRVTILTARPGVVIGRKGSEIDKLKPESLRIKEAVAGTATSLKRFTPKARGSAGPIIKRRCHVKITLSDE